MEEDNQQITGFLNDIIFQHKGEKFQITIYTSEFEDGCIMENIYPFYYKFTRYAL